jgi:hypothetical protein
MEIFLLNWDDHGFLHASEDTKACWVVQKLTGFHYHHFKVFHSVNQSIKTKLTINATAPIDEMDIEATPATTFSDSNDDDMETGKMMTSIDTSSPTPPMSTLETLSDEEINFIKLDPHKMDSPAQNALLDPPEPSTTSTVTSALSARDDNDV